MSQVSRDPLVEELFNAGLDALSQGQPVEPLLAPHPQHAVAVRSMLEFASNLRSVLDVAPSPTARAATLYQVVARAENPRGFWARLIPSWGRPRAVASAVVVAGLLLGTTSGAVAASASSLPGEPLYLVKTQWEEVQLTLALTGEQKVELATNRAAVRTEEIATLAARGKPVPAETIARLASQTSSAITLVETTKNSNVERLLSLTQRQLEVLTQVAAAAPASAQPGLERALEATQQGRERVKKALERRAKPAATPGQAGGQSPSGQGRGGQGDDRGPAPGATTVGQGGQSRPGGTPSSTEANRPPPRQGRATPQPANSGSSRPEAPTSPPGADRQPPGQANRADEDRKETPRPSSTAAAQPGRQPPGQSNRADKDRKETPRPSSTAAAQPNRQPPGQTNRPADDRRETPGPSSTPPGQQGRDPASAAATPPSGNPKPTPHAGPPQGWDGERDGSSHPIFQRRVETARLR